MRKKIIEIWERIWEKTKDFFDVVILVLVFTVPVALVAGGFVWAVNHQNQTYRKAKEVPELRKQLAEACKQLDQLGFDGNPFICLDSEGNPYNR